MEQILQQAKRAKQASEELALWGAAAKQRLLEAMAAALEAGAEDILRANRQDLARAEAEGRGRGDEGTAGRCPAPRQGTKSPAPRLSALRAGDDINI